MLVAEREQGDLTIVEIGKRRLDASVAGEFKKSMIGLVDKGRRQILVDLADVDFIDSSGLGALVSVLKYLGRDGSLELAGLNKAVEKVFNLTRMSNVFVIHERAPGR